MDTSISWLTAAVLVISSLLGGGLGGAVISWFRHRHLARQEKWEYYFTSFEKQIDSAEKREDADEVERLRPQYERELEGWRSQQKLEFAAPKTIRQDGPSLPEDELQRLVDLIDQASNAPTATLSSVSHVLRGNVYYEMGELDSAEVEYSVAIKLNPTFAPAYSSRGCAYGSKGEFDQAVADFNRAISIDPYDGDSYYNRGVTYGRKKEYEQAIEDYREAILNNSNYIFWAYNNLGVAYVHKGKVDEALENFDNAIKINSNRPEAYSNRGNCHVTKGQYTKAMADFDRALSIDPDHANAYCGMGNVHLMLGNKTEAIEAYHRALELGFDRAPIEQVLATLDG